MEFPLTEKEKVPSTSREIEEGTERDSETGAKRTEGSKDLMIAAYRPADRLPAARGRELSSSAGLYC